MTRANRLSIRLLISLLALSFVCIAPNAFADNDDDGMLNNASTELKVKMQLLEKIGWDMMSVDVEAAGGTVLLMGFVDTDANRELATEVAKSVDGINTVHNKIRVDRGDREVKAKKAAPVSERVNEGEREVKDAVLEGRVKTALIAEIGLDAFDVEVEATDGVVSLRGDLKTKAKKRVAMDVAKNMKGVDKVVDLLELE